MYENEFLNGLSMPMLLAGVAKILVSIYFELRSSKGLALQGYYSFRFFK